MKPLQGHGHKHACISLRDTNYAALVGHPSKFGPNGETMIDRAALSIEVGHLGPRSHKAARKALIFLINEAATA
jgi:hypothetical protein